MNLTATMWSAVVSISNPAALIAAIDPSCRDLRPLIARCRGCHRSAWNLREDTHVAAFCVAEAPHAAAAAAPWWR